MDILEKITGYDETERAKLRRWAGNLPEHMKREHNKLKRDVYYVLKKKYPDCDKNDLEIAAEVLASDKMKYAREVLHRKAKNGDDEALNRLDEIEMKKILQSKKKTRGKGEKHRKVKARFQRIGRLLEAGASWPRVAVYLKERHKITISPSYVRRLYLGIENLKNASRIVLE